MEEISNFIDEIIAEDLRNGEADHVHTRFPPEPNGYLHIGHAKDICIDFGIAEKCGVLVILVYIVYFRWHNTVHKHAVAVISKHFN